MKSIEFEKYRIWRRLSKKNIKTTLLQLRSLFVYAFYLSNPKLTTLYIYFWVANEAQSVTMLTLG